jgi:hypothetical protein
MYNCTLKFPQDDTFMPFANTQEGGVSYGNFKNAIGIDQKYFLTGYEK